MAQTNPSTTGGAQSYPMASLYVGKFESLSVYNEELLFFVNSR
jgi:hypothetical protein